MHQCIPKYVFKLMCPILFYTFLLPFCFAAEAQPGDLSAAEILAKARSQPSEQAVETLQFADAKFREMPLDAVYLRTELLKHLRKLERYDELVDVSKRTLLWATMPDLRELCRAAHTDEVSVLWTVQQFGRAAITTIHSSTLDNKQKLTAICALQQVNYSPEVQSTAISAANEIRRRDKTLNLPTPPCFINAFSGFGSVATDE